jgi:hypothetical protein
VGEIIGIVMNQSQEGGVPSYCKMLAYEIQEQRNAAKAGDIPERRKSTGKKR